MAEGNEYALLGTHCDCDTTENSITIQVAVVKVKETEDKKAFVPETGEVIEFSAEYGGRIVTPNDLKNLFSNLGTQIADALNSGAKDLNIKVQ